MRNDELKKEDKYVGKVVTVTKIVDNFNGLHPNGIDNGYATTKKCKVLEVGKGAIFTNEYYQVLITSKVLSIDKRSNTFKTRNSTYKITFPKVNKTK